MTNLAFIFQGAAGGGLLVTLMPFLLIFGVFYFLIIVPQRRRQKALQEMISQLKRLASLGQYVSPLHVALVYSGIGDTEQALAWLQKAYNEHAWALVVLGVEPRLDPLRSDSRFQSLLSKVGLKQR